MFLLIGCSKLRIGDCMISEATILIHQSLSQRPPADQKPVVFWYEIDKLAVTHNHSLDLLICTNGRGFRVFVICNTCRKL